MSPDFEQAIIIIHIYWDLGTYWETPNILCYRSNLQFQKSTRRGWKTTEIYAPKKLGRKKWTWHSREIRFNIVQHLAYYYNSPAPVVTDRAVQFLTHFLKKTHPKGRLFDMVISDRNVHCDMFFYVSLYWRDLVWLTIWRCSHFVPWNDHHTAVHSLLCHRLIGKVRQTIWLLSLIALIQTNRRLFHPPTPHGMDIPQFSS